ncbi:CAP-Gly domain-containing linker protein 1 isoform X1 [Capsicum galapagoense]
MANTDSTVAAPASSASPLSARSRVQVVKTVKCRRKENVVPASSKIAELTESRQELLNRIQSLKTDLQSWRYKLDGQVKVYRNELSELKKSLNVEVEKLRSEFQELKTTLQQQQEDVTTSLRKLGLQDASEETKESEDAEIDINEENAKDLTEDAKP